MSRAKFDSPPDSAIDLVRSPFASILAGLMPAARVTRESSLRKTGSARTATLFSAGLRPRVSRRSKESVDADGATTISCSEINGRYEDVEGAARAEKGM